MKNKTKQNLLIGGAAIAGIYILMRGGEKVEGGGFGGGGGIPLLPGDTEGAAESDTIINYILGGGDPFAGFDEGEDVQSKKTLTYAPSLIPTYPLEYYASGGFSELSEAATQPQKLKSVMTLQHYADPFAYVFSGRKEGAPDLSGMVDTKKVATISQTPKTKPTQWGEASVSGFFNFLAPLTQLGKGARGRDVMKTVNASKKVSVVTLKAKETRIAETRRERVDTASRGGSFLTSTSLGRGVHFTTGTKTAGTYKKGLR